VSNYTHGSRTRVMAKEVVAGMSIRDPSHDGLGSMPATVLVISTKYEETTRILQGPNDKQVLLEENAFEMLLMENPTTWQCHVCRISPDTLVSLASPEFVMPPSSRKAEEP